ncbi:SGNH/GDSL hydrolase family protein [Xanthobacter versatilis]|uniref:SGNH/GDSL hydrolase family protein n=1 Tax=Xanthobacter autotrophicus (strain ATCC BAA-1158 / Py2) TaxID=78245 RepID=UPI0037277A5F
MPFNPSTFVRFAVNQYSYRTSDLGREVQEPSYFNPARGMSLSVGDMIMATVAIGAGAETRQLVVTQTDPFVVTRLAAGLDMAISAGALQAVPGYAATFFNLGCSRDGMIYTDVSARRNLAANHFFNQANIRLGHAMTLLGTNAVSGDRTDQFLADSRLAECIAAAPKFAIIGSPVNDFAQSVAYDPWTDQVLPAIAKLRQAGIVPIVLTEPGATSLVSDAVRGRIQAYNAAVRAYGRLGGIIVFDIAPLLVDPSSATFAWKAGFSADGTHYTTPNQIAAGKAFAALMRPFLPAKRSRLPGGGEGPLAATQIFSNPGYLTATGGVGGAGTTGTLPAGVTQVSADTGVTANVSVVANGDGTNSIRAVVTATQAGRYRIQNTIAATTGLLLTGRRYLISGQLSIDAGATGLASAFLMPGIQFGSSTDWSDCYADTSSVFGTQTGVEAETLDFEVDIPASATLGAASFVNPRWVAWFSGAGTAAFNFRAPVVDRY